MPPLALGELGILATGAPGRPGSYIYLFKTYLEGAGSGPGSVLVARSGESGSVQS